jgi:hypothetical protein
MNKTKRGSALTEGLGSFFLIVIGIVVAVLLIWGVGRLSVTMYRDIAPKRAEAEREVYVNTPSYINGKNEILMKYMSEYNKAKTDQERNALKETILNEASTVDINKLNPTIRSFIQSL